jgi:hypothetical protein
MSPSRPHNIYIAAAFTAAGGMRPFVLPHRTNPTQPTPPMSFSRHKGIYYVALRKMAGRKVLANFPSGHAMSSRRLFLSGLLSSRAHLRFAGLTILPTQNAPRYRQLASRTPGTAKPLAQAHSYWHNGRRTRAGFPTLESPDRCLKDRVHLSLPPAATKFMMTQIVHDAKSAAGCGLTFRNLKY